MPEVPQHVPLDPPPPGIQGFFKCTAPPAAGRRMLHLVEELVRGTPQPRNASATGHTHSLPQRPTPLTRPGRSHSARSAPCAIRGATLIQPASARLPHRHVSGRRTAAQAAGSGCRPIHITSVRKLARLPGVGPSDAPPRPIEVSRCHHVRRGSRRGGRRRARQPPTFCGRPCAPT